MGPPYIHPRREVFEHGLLPLPTLISISSDQTTLNTIKNNLLSNSDKNIVQSNVVSNILGISQDHALLVLETLQSVLHENLEEKNGVDIYDLVIYTYIQSYKRLLPKGHKDAASVADVWPTTSAFDGYLSALSPLQVVILYTIGISQEHALHVLETLEFVLNEKKNEYLEGKNENLEKNGVEIWDLVIYMYIQSYKRLLPKGHKDAASVADVWPIIYRLFRLCCNSRRFMPSQADDEAHQLSYLQKHLANILSLLSDSVEAEGEESQVLTMEKFEHLQFLLYFSENGSDKISLSQVSPFFSNSDPDMPAAPVPTNRIHEWLLESIVSAIEHLTERASAKENGPASASDPDVPMTDACANSVKPSVSARGSSLIEGVSKTSYVKQASEVKGSSVKVVNCHDSVIYILAPLKYATVYGCSDSTIVLGAIGKAVRVEHCERVHIIVAAKRICIANCRECVFFLGVNQRPLNVGDNHKLQVAPYNTFYPQLEEHMNQVGIEATTNIWEDPVTLGVVDPHDSLSHPAGVSDVQPESAACLDPDQFTNFLIPDWFEGSSSGATKSNPFTLPEAYMACQHRNNKNLGEIKQILRDTPLEDSRKRELSNALHVYFKDWLYASGNIRQLYCLQGE